jgi:hypothetical protein
MLSFDKPTLILAGNYGVSSLNITEYWVKRSSWRTVGALTLSGDTLTTVGNNRIGIPFEVDSNGHYNVWLRLGFAPCRGKLAVFIDGEPVQSIVPESPYWSALKWVKVTDLELLKGRHLISLENDGNGYNDIDAIAIIKPEDLEKRLDETLKLLQDFPGRIVYFLEAEKFFFDSSSWSLNVVPYEGCVICSENPEVTASSAPLKITIPRKGSYMIATRVATGPNYGTFYLNLDGNLHPIQCNNSVSRFEWRGIGPISFDVGEHLISVSGTGSVELDTVLIYSLKEGEKNLSIREMFSSYAPDVSINYSEVNPCLYQVHVNANEPFTLVFSDTYSPFWKIFVNNEEISPVLAYAIVNSFYINKTGQLTLTLYFTGQSYADVGLAISTASFAMIVFSTGLYLLYKRVLQRLHARRVIKNFGKRPALLMKDFKVFKNVGKQKN